MKPRATIDQGSRPLKEQLVGGTFPLSPIFLHILLITCILLIKKSVGDVISNQTPQSVPCIHTCRLLLLSKVGNPLFSPLLFRNFQHKNFISSLIPFNQERQAT